MLLNESRAAQLMDAASLDALVATRMENVFYLGEFWNVNHQLFPFDQQTYAIISRDHLSSPVLVISVGDSDQALAETPRLRLAVRYGTFYREWLGTTPLNERENLLKRQTIDLAPQANALDALIVALEEMKLTDKRIGLDKTFNPAFRPELERRLPKLGIEPAAALLSQLRMVKTPAEVRRLRRVTAITEQGIPRSRIRGPRRGERA